MCVFLDYYLEYSESIAKGCKTNIYISELSNQSSKGSEERGFSVSSAA